MTKKSAPAKDRIFDAAVACLEKSGLKKLTIRMIALEAGVNSAAINYYYGSKEALLDAVMKQTLQEMIKMPAELFETATGSLGDRLEVFFVGYLEGLFHWRGISRAHLYAPLMEGRYDTEFFRGFKEFFESLLEQSHRVDPSIGTDRLRLILIEIFSAILLPGLMPKAFIGFSNLDFDDIAARRAYDKDVIGRYFSRGR
jgi:AcrR family transcriptional regulator